MLTVTTPADDLALLTSEQLRVAAGLAKDDSSRDDDLAALGLRIAAEICSTCNIAIGTGAEPTLRRETLTETFRRVQGRSLILARRHNVELTSVDAGSMSFTVADLDVDAEAGIVRLDGWGHMDLRGATVVYAAGFATVPSDLIGVASDLVRVRISEASREIGVKSTSVEVVDIETVRTDYWVGSMPGSTSGSMPDELIARLSRYANPVAR